jgi:hypothetical protein
VKICTGIPHAGLIKPRTIECLSRLLIVTAQAKITYNGKPVTPEIIPLFEDAGPLELKRTRLALRALECESDYFLGIDSDQTFEPDALIRLMAHDKPMVGTSIASRHNGKAAVYGFDGKSLPRRRGLEQVAAVGLGFCLIKTPLLRKLGHPWFASEIGPDGKLVRGEDVHFCNQVRNAGFPIYVDHDLTIGHLTEHELKLEPEDMDANSVHAPPRHQQRR